MALSSCEAEFYAGAKALSFGLFLREVMRDWGFHGTDHELFTDSSSAKSFMERHGLGKNRHADKVPVDTGEASPWRLQVEEGVDTLQLRRPDDETFECKGDECASTENESED